MGELTYQIDDSTLQDHELAVYQTVLFVDMRAGDSKKPTASLVRKKSKEEENVLKETVSKYHHFKDLDF